MKTDDSDLIFRYNGRDGVVTDKVLQGGRMYLDNITRYVSTGSAFKGGEKSYRKMSFGPALLTLMAGWGPGAILKGYWSYMTVAMILISLACVLTVFKLSSYALTLQDALCADAVIFGTWIIDLSILELMYFTMWRDFTPWLLLIYLPVVLIPLFVGIKRYKSLKNESYNPKGSVKSTMGSVGFLCGILGMNFAVIFRDVDQSTAIIVVVVGFSIINCLMSFGLLSLQKLYYLKKYKIFK